MRIYHAVAFHTQYLGIVLELQTRELMQKIFHATTTREKIIHVLGSQEKIRRRGSAGPIPGRLLLSFAYHKSFDWYLEYAKKNKIVVEDIFLDSGAFSVFTKGDTIDIDEYADFVFEVEESKSIKNVIAINLDYMPKPTKKGKKLSDFSQMDKEAVDYAAEKSYENFQYLKKKGIPGLIPVFHFGEHFRWLDKILEDSDYISLGAMARSRTSEEKRKWLDEVFEYLDKAGSEARIHGLGLTNVRLMRRYPWYSVDSSTACLAAGMGNVIFPRTHLGEFVFDDSPNTLKVGDRLFDGKAARGTKFKVEEKEGFFYKGADIELPRTVLTHARTLNPAYKEQIEKYLEQYGYEFDDIFDYGRRIEINVIFMFNMEQATPVDREETKPYPGSETYGFDLLEEA